MSNVEPKDSRGFFVLPQAPEGAAYYTYGTPARGAGQYADPRLLSLLLLIEHRWQAMDNRKIGIGNISLASGAPFYPHSGHKTGRDVDIRLFRNDGKERSVTRFQEEYDRDATAQLIRVFFESPIIEVIYFNDASIPRVRPLPRHDDHFHVTIRP